MKRKHPITRLLSTTLALLVGLYSLPSLPDVHNVIPVAHEADPDVGMLLRQNRLLSNLFSLPCGLQHALWHVGAAVDACVSEIQRFALTPAAQADHQYEPDVPNQGTTNFIYQGTGTQFTFPPEVPTSISNNQFVYLDFWGVRHTGALPDQDPNDNAAFVLPVEDMNGKNPQSVEYHNSYFSEHDGSLGRNLFLADYLNSGPPYPLAVIERPFEVLTVQQNGYNWAWGGGYKNEWKNAYNGQTFTGSGSGNYGEPKWDRDNINFSLRENPYWRFSGYSGTLQQIERNNFNVAVKRRYSLYYWETNPEVVAALNQKITEFKQDPSNHFVKTPPAFPVKGFWVEIQPCKALPYGNYAGSPDAIPDFPNTDTAFKIAFPRPYAGLHNAQKFSKLTFYRPYVPPHDGAPLSDGVIGFLNNGDAAENAADHDPEADYVCVGAFAAYDSSDPDISSAIAHERQGIWNEKRIQVGPWPNPGDGKKATEAYDQLSPTVQDQVIAALNAGGERAQAAQQFLLAVHDLGVQQGTISSSYTADTDPTNQAGEPNSTVRPQELFATTLQLDPVDVVSGSQYYDTYDLQIPGRGMRTDFLRTYNSSFQADLSNRGFMPFGYGWTHTYNQFLYRFADDAIAYYNDHGQSIIFMPDGSGGYRAPPGSSLSLTKNEDGSYRVRDKDGTVLSFSGGLIRIASENKFFYTDGIAPYGTKQPVDAGRLQSITDRTGNQFKLSYSTGQLTLVTDPSGRTLAFTYDAGGRISTMVDPAGRTFTYRYDDNDNLVELVHPGNRHQSYTYTDHLMTSHSDLDSRNVWHFAYANQQVTRVTDPVGNQTDFTYSPGKTVQSIHEVDGRVFSTTFTIQNGDIVSKTDPQGSIFTYEYQNHRKTAESFNRGDQLITTTYEYDDKGNLTRTVDASGHETKIDYDPLYSQPVQITDPSGTTKITLDAHGNTTDIQDPAGRVVHYTIDQYGQTQAVTDPGQHITETAHDSFGQLVHVDTPTGGWTTYDYNALGQVVTVTDPTGVRRYGYDKNDHLKTYTDQLGQETQFVADANGNVTQITQPGGRVTRFTYDAKNQLIASQDNAGGTTSYDYTNQGQLWKATDANDNTTQFVRDGNGRVLKVIDPNNKSKSFDYDAAGNVVRVSDELDETTRYAYDPLNRVTAITDPKGQVTSLDYYWIGATKTITNPLGAVTRFNVNPVGQITDVIPPAPEGPTHYTYNSDGTLKRVEKPKGQTQDFTYNAANQVLTVQDTRKTTQYSYDAMGRLESISSVKGRTISFHHDALGRVTSVIDALGNPVEYSYYPSGELKSVRKINGALTEYSYDAAGRIDSISAPENRMTRFAYDKAGNLLQKTSPLGAQTAYTYDALNRLVAVSDLARGSKTSYDYDAVGRLVRTIDTNGQATKLTYDPLGRPVRVDAPLNQWMTFDYDPVGNLLKRTDANGHATSYEYNADNRVTKITDALLHTTALSYDSLGNMVQVQRMADGAVTRIDYNDLNLPEVVTDPLQFQTRREYDEFGNLTSVSDAKNRTTRYDYDALNRLQSVTAPLGKTTLLSYDRVGNMASVTNAMGAVTRRVYDLANRLRFVYEPLGRTTEYDYNALDEVTLVRDANGNQQSVDYDRVGRPIRKMNALGFSTDFFYDRLDRLTRKIDAMGHSTQYDYDELNRLTRVTDPAGYQTAYMYDPVGNLTGMQNARGKLWSYHYDELNRMDMERDPLQRVTQRTFDAVGNLSKVRNANGRLISYDHDMLGRVTHRQTQDDLTSYAYDEVGNLTGYQNNRVKVQRRFDDLNRLTEEDNQTWGKSTLYGYDTLDRLTSLTTPLGRTVRYAYNDLNQLTSVTDPEGDQTSYQYDRGGRLTNVAYPTGIRTAMTYDPADQVRSLVHYGRDGQGLQGYNYTYDRTGNRTQLQELDGSTTNFQYDSLDRLTRVDYPINAILAERSALLASAPGSKGGHTTQQANSSVDVSPSPGVGLTGSGNFGHASSRYEVVSVRPLNARGVVAAKSTGNGSGSGNGSLPNNGNGGSPNGNGSQANNGNGGTQNGNSQTGNAQGSNNGGGTGGLTGQTGGSQDHGNNNGAGGNGNRSQLGNGNGQANSNGSDNGQGNAGGANRGGNGHDKGQNQGHGNGKSHGKGSHGPGSNHGRGKNSPGALTQPPYWADPVAWTQYTYDEVGNRTSETDPTNGETDYTYDDANQLKKAGDKSYQYDDNGNLTSETNNGQGVSYTYDSLNQLTGVQQPDGTQDQYQYDPMGRLIQSQYSSSPDVRGGDETTRYAYTGQTLLAEFTGEGAPLAEYYQGNGDPIERRMFGNHGRKDPYAWIQTRGNQLYYLHDALGSVTGMTDHLGTPVLKYREDAFGQPLSGILDPYNSQLLTGKPYDTQSGLYYFGSRWYDASTGRFTTQDSYRGTLNDPDSLHRYAYVNNNPANYIDAWGFLPEYKPQPQTSFFDRVTQRLGGVISGVTNAVGGAIDAIKADPWKAVAIGAGVVGVVALAAVFPAAIPAILSVAQSAATNFIVGQATDLAVGLAEDAATTINPELGTGLKYLEEGVQLVNAGTSILSGGGALLATNLTNLSSMASLGTLADASAITGGLSSITNTFGVNVPGLDETSHYLGMASTVGQYAGQFGNQYQLADAQIRDDSYFATHGTQVAWAPNEASDSGSESFDLAHMSKGTTPGGIIIRNVVGGAAIALGSLTLGGGLMTLGKAATAVGVGFMARMGIDRANQAIDFVGSLGEGPTQSLDNPSTLEGAEQHEVEQLVPKDWIKSETRRGGGTRFANPKRPGDQVRIMPGNPADPNPVKQGPYLRISKNGQTSDPVPLKGNPTINE